MEVSPQVDPARARQERIHRKAMAGCVCTVFIQLGATWLYKRPGTFYQDSGNQAGGVFQPRGKKENSGAITSKLNISKNILLNKDGWTKLFLELQWNFGESLSNDDFLKMSFKEKSSQWIELF